MRLVRICAAAAWVGCAGEDAEPPQPTPTAEPFPRCAAHDPLRQPFFGDTHVHGALSLDANLQGTRARPDDAYRFAKGEPIGLAPYDAAGEAQRTLRLARPLDFAALTDHAEFLGAVDLCSTPGSAAYDHADCVAFREEPDWSFVTLNATTAAPPESAAWPELCGDDPNQCLDAGLDVWQEIRDAAEAHYDRTDGCAFTTFVGFEWSGGPGTYNLHRNVIFRNEVVPELPVSYFDEPEPSGLWDALARDCLDHPPCDVLAIPHNSNLSNGLMFQSADEIRSEEATVRAAMEPLVEIFQHKGSSECGPGSLAADEECAFESLPYNSLSGANLDFEGEPQRLDFVRDALGEGLAIAAETGVNPYAFGIVASTDTHVGAPGSADEVGFPGHGGAGASNRDALPVGLPDGVLFNPGGLAVVWAEENSREGLFRAMRRREVYGTSGPRIVLRFFGGRGFDASMCGSASFVRDGYDGGVPMGGELAAGSGAPTFAIWALSDPGVAELPGAPLERLQVVKGWLDGDVVRFEVQDAAASDVGAPDMCAVWTDPDFDPSAPAFWYVRALEVETPRWHAQSCEDAGIVCPTDDDDWGACCDDRVAPTVRERAWSSPIWYVP